MQEKLSRVGIHYSWSFVFVLTIFNEVAYLTFKPIFLNLLWFDCGITLKSILGTNQY